MTFTVKINGAITTRTELEMGALISTHIVRDENGTEVSSVAGLSSDMVYFATKKAEGNM